MKRFLLFKDINGKRSPHGTLLLFDDGSDAGISITSHPLSDHLNVQYFFSRSGLADDAEKILVKREIHVAAPGCKADEIAPHLYEIEALGQE